MDFNSKPDTHKKGSDGVSEKYLYDVEKQLYNVAMSYMPHLQQASMEDKLEELTKEEGNA
jgi:hypothetical protein